MWWANWVRLLICFKLISRSPQLLKITEWSKKIRLLKTSRSCEGGVWYHPSLKWWYDGYLTRTTPSGSFDHVIDVKRNTPEITILYPSTWQHYIPNVMHFSHSWMSSTSYQSISIYLSLVDTLQYQVAKVCKKQNTSFHFHFYFHFHFLFILICVPFSGDPIRTQNFSFSLFFMTTTQASTYIRMYGWSAYFHNPFTRHRNNVKSKKETR